MRRSATVCCALRDGDDTAFPDASSRTLTRALTLTPSAARSSKRRSSLALVSEEEQLAACPPRPRNVTPSKAKMSSRGPSSSTGWLAERANDVSSACDQDVSPFARVALGGCDASPRSVAPPTGPCLRTCYSCSAAQAGHRAMAPVAAAREKVGGGAWLAAVLASYHPSPVLRSPTRGGGGGGVSGGGHVGRLRRVRRVLRHMNLMAAAE